MAIVNHEYRGLAGIVQIVLPERIWRNQIFTTQVVQQLSGLEVTVVDTGQIEDSRCEAEILMGTEKRVVLMAMFASVQSFKEFMRLMAFLKR